MSVDNDTIAQPIIDKMFDDNPSLLVEHHLTSYNEFFKTGMTRIMKEKNPIRIMKGQDPLTKAFKFRCNLYLGGKSGERVYYGKPVIYDEDNPHFMFPNEARLRNMTYGVTVHYDVEVDFFIEGEEPSAGADESKEGADESKEGTAEQPTRTIILEKIYMGKFPIMLMSDLCVLRGLDSRVRFEMGECKNDYGGYFIIDGKEKCIVPQEKFADNMLYVRGSVNELYGAAADIRCAAEDTSKPVRTFSVRMVLPSTTYSNGQIVAVIPNVRKPIPLFILMRALGVEPDKAIMEHCLLDIEKNESFLDLFIPSVHDANRFFTQELALKFIATFTKGKTIPHTLEILTDLLLPNIGEMNFKDKAFFVGYMVNEMLKVHMKIKKPTDRDSFRYKRVELPGTLLSGLFKEYYTLQLKNIFKKIDKEYYYKEGIYQENFHNLIELNTIEFFSERIVDSGIRKAFKGNWGAEAHTKRLGVVQDLNRLSYNSALAQLRKVSLSIDASAKITGPLLLHGSQWGMIDPVDTPDGGNVGLHKHMSMAVHITSGCPSTPIILWLRKHANMRMLTEATAKYISSRCKVLVNGSWVGCIDTPIDTEAKMKLYRRNGLLPIYTSVYWNIIENTLFVYTDAGRLSRPVYYVENKMPSYARQNIIDLIMENNFTWKQLLNGFSKKKDDSLNTCRVYDSPDDLYGAVKLETLERSVIEYIDNAEEEGTLIAMHQDRLGVKKYTHIEIHPSLILGIMGNQVVFPENNQLPRDLFACGQMKQAVSLYHSNYQNRIDKMGVVLNNGQIPLVKSRYLDKINKEQHPYGENVIVAIMCYGGYNVEDAILFNGGSLDRGIFRTTYYNMYESYEESSTVTGSTIDSKFAKVNDEQVIGLKPGFDYGDLDEYGLIRENTLLDDKKVLIGKITTNLEDPENSLDASVFPKKGQLGYVDKTFITDNGEGFRIAKVRVRNERIPSIGDKFCSRCGQKGTIGLVIPEANMPFTEDGIRPDIIVNPHALPSRMTIGQLIETLMGKACCLYGGFGDCTAFMNKGSKHKEFGDMLKTQGFHSSGNQVLYNGETGEQMQSDIFMGPTYYMRLKHMVKDKINYRARGPRTVLTRQTVQGRANDGGLRIGEMERDGIIGHGAANFLQESMLVRGDEYYMAVCNVTGMLAIYNDSLKIFMSPQADGPIQFKNSLEGNMHIENISKYGRSFSIIRVPYAFKLMMH
jgi:DNA-directed RNA polymerase II subunit RPB2